MWHICQPGPVRAIVRPGVTTSAKYEREGGGGGGGGGSPLTLAKNKFYTSLVRLNCMLHVCTV